MPMLARRQLLLSLAATPLVGLPLTARANTAAEQAARSVGLISSNVCMVMPEATEGPYYIDPKLLRDDITEGRDGVGMDLQIQVVTADCVAIEGARVDVWHCDAQGNYSGFAGQGSEDTEGQTFLRGTLATDAGGLVTFRTIYPGWYRGRTTHVHFKVFLDARNVLTSQIYFPDALSQYLFDTVPAYSRDGLRETVNANDRLALEAGDGAFAALREKGNRYVASLVVGVAE